MKVLIVDDERAIRNSLKEILEMENYQAETAENGKRKNMTPFSATSRCPGWTASRSCRS